MLTDLDDASEDDHPELITDPIIKRFASKLHQLTWELIGETKDYPINQEQIDQLISSMTTLRALLVFAEDLTLLDAMLRMTFPDDYYSSTDDITPMLTNFPLSGEN